LEKFREHFAGFEDNYVIIGGTACDIALRDTDMRPRATDDIDMILIFIAFFRFPMNLIQFHTNGFDVAVQFLRS
jgi:hypothetical protein